MSSLGTPISIGAVDAARLLSMKELIEALRIAFINGCTVPERHHHTIPVPGEEAATLLLMPAWQEKHGDDGFIGVKLVNVFPGNAKKGLPGLTSSYLLYDSGTGAHLATIDGGTITSRRTVAVSALAASFLAREDANKLFVVGAGRVASLIPDAYRAVRNIKQIKVWDIHQDSAVKLVEQLCGQGIDASVETDLEVGTRWADIISCATLSMAPLIRGDWLQAGMHLDLIGAFTPEMREADDEAVAKSAVFIDADEAFQEAGDLVQPIRSGVFKQEDCQAKLSELCNGTASGRDSAEQITLFKAVGTALSDLAASALVYQRFGKSE